MKVLHSTLSQTPENCIIVTNARIDKTFTIINFYANIDRVKRISADIGIWKIKEKPKALITTTKYPLPTSYEILKG